MKLLIPANLEVRKEALNRFIESDPVLGKFVSLKVVFKICRSEPVPVNHMSFYYASRRDCHEPQTDSAVD